MISIHFQLNEFISFSVSLILTAVLIGISVMYTEQARVSAFSERDIKASSEELSEERKWSVYEGNKTGADVVDFIIRHKDVCDIVIRDTGFISNPKLNGYQTSGTLVMGLSDKKNITESFWDISFVYDNIIGGKGDRTYTAVLLYNGQLSPEYVGTEQVRGGKITGIMYTAG